MLVLSHSRCMGECSAGGTIKAYHGSEASKNFYDARIKATPMPRWVEASEIGDMVSFLCSKRGTPITGQALPVDNGLHLIG